MPTFEELSDYDFERLVADLLTARWGIELETFPRGRDGGIDIRALGPTGPPLRIPAGKEVVVQCKHRPNATISQLRTVLKQEAVNSLPATVSRYVLATSARLTRANKNEIVDILGGRVRLSDVLGRNDLEDLLRRHPDVERANPKLWLGSSAALNAMLNHIEHLRSASLAEELKTLRSTHVETPAVLAAQERLNQYGFVVLAGPPGVGKSTTAHILMLRLMANGWQPIAAVADVRELEAQLMADTRQVMLFDDFLGQNSLDAKLRHGADAELIRLVRLVRGDRTKCLILTTRDYILRQAQQTYEPIADEEVLDAKVTVRLTELTPDVRAHILYNQLYFSPLRQAAAEAKDKQRRYMEVVRHRNYNPRLTHEAIAAAVRGRTSSETSGRFSQDPGSVLTASGTSAASPSTAPAKQTDVATLDVPSYLINALEDPQRLWKHVFLYQLSNLQRCLVIVRMSMGYRPVFIEDLYRATTSYLKDTGIIPSISELDSALSILDGDLLVASSAGEGRSTAIVDALDPGVADVTTAFIMSYDDVQSRLARTATAFEQIRWLATAHGMLDRRRTGKALAVPDKRMDLVDELTTAAERTILSEPVSPADTLFVDDFVRHEKLHDIGSRMSLLANLYGISRRKPQTSLPDEVVPVLVSGLGTIPRSELVLLASVLRTTIPDHWRSRRTDVEFHVLRRLEDPADFDEWELLRDILDVVPATDSFCEDATARLEELMEERLDEIRDGLEDDIVDTNDIDELEVLSELAQRWGINTDIDGLLEACEESQSLHATPDPSWPKLFEWPPENANENGGVEPHVQPGLIFNLL